MKGKPQIANLEKSIRACHCGVQAITHFSKKDNENKGRQYFTCSKSVCKFFKWGKERELYKNPQHEVATSINAGLKFLLESFINRSLNVPALKIEADFTTHALCICILMDHV